MFCLQKTSRSDCIGRKESNMSEYAMDRQRPPSHKAHIIPHLFIQSVSNISAHFYQKLSLLFGGVVLSLHRHSSLAQRQLPF